MRSTSYVAQLKRKQARQAIIADLCETGSMLIRAIAIGTFGSLAITLTLYCIGATGA